MRSSSKWPTLLIILFTVGLVLGPVFVPREIARWYLAAAANAYRKQDTLLGRHYLERAAAWDPTVQQEDEYVLAQLPPIELQTIDGQLELIEKITSLNPAQGAQLAIEVASELADNYDFLRAVRAVNIVFQATEPLPEPFKMHAYNLRAYNRALAGIELDEALKDIDRALEIQQSNSGLISQTSDPALLDTKAWVLHRLERNEEALKLLNEAIPRMEKQLTIADKKPKPSPNSSKRSDKPAEQSPTNESVKESPKQSAPQPAESTDASTSESASDATLGNAEPLPAIRARINEAKKRLSTKLFSAGVLRFHRLRVLQALDKFEEAKADQQWLEDYDIPIVDELF